MQATLSTIEHGVDHVGTGIEYYTRYAIIHGDVTENQLDRQISDMIRAENQIPHVLGYLFKHKRDVFGKTEEQIALEHGYSDDQVVKDRITVANRIPVENLGYDVSYSVYRAVTKFDAAEQKYWLERAQNESIGANTLRSMIKLASGDDTPLRFPEPKPKSDHGVEPLAALGSAGGGGADYVVDRQDEDANSYGNDKSNGNGRYDDIDYALGYKAERLSHDSDLEEDVYALQLERDNLRERLTESEERRKDTLEALADNQKLITRLRKENEQGGGIVERLVTTLTDNHLAYDWFLLKQLYQNDVITHEHYDALMALRNEESFDNEDGVNEVVYVNDDF